MIMPSFKHKDIAAMEDETESSPPEVQAGKTGFKLCENEWKT